MIYPLIPYALTGFVWYQGENNWYDPDQYACMFPAMISDWRTLWGNTNGFPFLFVQLEPMPDSLAHGSLPSIRWAQEAAYALPLVGMATAIDLGDPTSPYTPMHPRNKQSVGARLELIIGAMLYGQDEPFSGPTVANIATMHKGGAYVITITYGAVPSGMWFNETIGCSTCCSQSPFEFLDGGNWVPSDVPTLQNNLAQFVHHGALPQQIRYAWEDWPQCILYSDGANLPAPPFIANVPAADV